MEKKEDGGRFFSPLRITHLSFPSFDLTSVNRLNAVSWNRINLIYSHSFTFAFAPQAPAMATPTVYPNTHVGFDSITSQIERKLLKRGFQFNVICVGKLSPLILLSCMPVAR